MSARGSRVEPASLKSIRLKLSRGNRQLQALERSIDTYWERNPMQVIGEFNPNFTQHTSRLSIHEHPPLDWSVRLGEAIHNLRSALDHTVSQLALHHLGYHVDSASFPIFSDPRKFQAEGRLQLRDVSDHARSVIESLQPFKASSPRAPVLWYINQIWKRDQNREIRLQPAIAHDIYTLTVDPPDPNPRVTIVEGLKEDGAMLATVDFGKPMPEMRVVLEPALYIANEFSWLLDPDMTTAHRRVIHETTEIIERLLALID